MQMTCSGGSIGEDERGSGDFRHGDKGPAAAICKDKEGSFLGAPAVIFDSLANPASLEAHACSEALALAHLVPLMIRK